MEIYVGTSGFSYDWNPDGFQWFVENSKLNCVELNMSFYRIPFRNVVKRWSKDTKNIRWSIKVNKFITHQYKFGGESLKIWSRFKDVFTDLDKFIDFYLFQIPPKFNNTDKVLEFADKIKLGRRFALEIRNKDLLEDEELCKKLQKKVVLVSVDSPDFKNKIFRGETIYLRMHGRTAWYSHNYNEEELSEICDKLIKMAPKKVYVFFNNNHNMLENARTMLNMLIKKI